MPWKDRMEPLWRGKCRTLGDLIDAPSKVMGDKAVLIFEGRQTTYSELNEAANRVANGLGSRGVESGDRVAMHIDNRPEFITIFLGAMKAGAVLVPTNVMYTASEMEHILADSGAKFLFVLGSLAAKFEKLAPRLPDLVGVVEVNPQGSGETPSLECLIADADPFPPEVSVDPDDVAIIQYTSGTTGQPKGAMISHNNILAAVANTTNLPNGIEPREDDVTLVVLPLFHAYALDMAVCGALLGSQTLVVVNRFDPELVFSLFEKYRVTIFHGAPPMYHSFANTPGLERYDVSSLRICYSGAAPLPTLILERFRDLTGIEICEGYGLSETSPVLTLNAAGPVNKPGSVGPPIPQVELRLVDEMDREVPPDEVGEIVARGPNVFKGYWNREKETAAAMRGGWFHTGDLGRRDEDGYYYIVDRKNDMILVSGFNVYPIELENAILRHPKILDCAVIGVPSEYQGESVKAFLVLKPGERMEVEEFIAYCREYLAAFKVPKYVSFVDSLPKSATGKVLKRELRAGELHAE